MAPGLLRKENNTHCRQVEEIAGGHEYQPGFILGREGRGSVGGGVCLESKSVKNGEGED